MNKEIYSYEVCVWSDHAICLYPDRAQLARSGIDANNRSRAYWKVQPVGKLFVPTVSTPPWQAHLIMKTCIPKFVQANWDASSHQVPRENARGLYGICMTKTNLYFHSQNTRIIFLAKKRQRLQRVIDQRQGNFLPCLKKETSTCFSKVWQHHKNYVKAMCSYLCGSRTVILWATISRRKQAGTLVLDRPRLHSA